MKLDEGKIQVMLNCPRPTNITELRGFLWLIGYYRNFVQNYGNILKNGKFIWNEEAEAAFVSLK